MRKRMKKVRAFTLIELLIVITIIAILAALIFVSLSAATTKARDAQVKNDVSEIGKALEVARITNAGTGANQYQNTSGSKWQAISSTGAFVDGNITALQDDSSKTLVPGAPTNPVSGAGYWYKVVGDDHYVFGGLSSGGWCEKDGSTFAPSETGIVSTFNPAGAKGKTVCGTTTSGT